MPELTGSVCPECASYAVLPHCGNEGCLGRWCDRCLWANGADCNMSDPPMYPDRMRPDKEGNVQPMRQYKPITQIGEVKHNYYPGQSIPYPVGYVFDTDNDLPSWPTEELKAMQDMGEHIRTLPGK